MPGPFGFPTNPPWVKQFNPAPPQGSPYSGRTATPRGLYEFGMPESLIRINFPDDQDENTALPWYWYYPTQQPLYFSFLGGVWGPGWVREPIFSVIKILAADTQPMRPVPQVGFGSVEAAARAGNPASFGRINFTPPHFWFLATNQDITGGRVQDRPRFAVRNGILHNTNRGISQTSFRQQIEEDVTRWHDRWNLLASQYNAQAAGVSASEGFRYVHQAEQYRVLLPSGPPTFVSQFQTELALFANAGNPAGRYMGPVPGTAFFNINTITTQAYAFRIAIGQLNDAEWDMNVFPPREVSNSLTIKSSLVTGKYNGFSATPVPFAGPQLV